MLLGGYVETLGGDAEVDDPDLQRRQKRAQTLGNIRFIPAIFLVLLYSKNKDTISFIPEFLGFFSYQLGSILQAFNTDAYGESTKQN